MNIVNKKTLSQTKKNIKSEISDLKEKMGKLNREEKKEKSEYEDKLYWMQMAEGNNEDQLQEEYLNYLKLMIEKKTDKSDKEYLRICELTNILSNLNVYSKSDDSDSDPSYYDKIAYIIVKHYEILH